MCVCWRMRMQRVGMRGRRTVLEDDGVPPEREYKELGELAKHPSVLPRRCTGRVGPLHAMTIAGLITYFLNLITRAARGRLQFTQMRPEAKYRMAWDCI